MNQDFEKIAEHIYTILSNVKNHPAGFYSWMVSDTYNIHILLRAEPDGDNHSLLGMARAHSLQGIDRLDFQEYLLNQIALWRFSSLCTSWITEDDFDFFGIRFLCYEYSKEFVLRKLVFLDKILTNYLSSDDSKDHLDDMFVDRIKENWITI